MRLRTIVRSFLFLFLSIWITTDVTRGQPESVPSAILDSIGNVASSATNFLDSAASKGLEFKLRRFFEKFRSLMRYGIPGTDIPSLEPFKVDGISVETDNPEIGNVSVIITDLTVYGLSTFMVDGAKLSLNGPTIAVNLSFPVLDTEGYYNISGIFGDIFTLFGSGPFKVKIYGFHVESSVVLGFSRGLYLRDFDLDFGLRSASYDVENFMGGEEVGKVMNKVFEELTPQIVEIIKPDILPGIREYAAYRLNETIQHLTMRDLFNVLLGEHEFRDILIPLP
ncbi:hypothetical protein KPH14_010046 [Odynerus spinipes]|uniref:Hemolymph juvenile hormone binding protein n=1 Tax=Odynerus spinipes TaxID=1348599 RepID=A0AAD9RTK6_9HYME|nr:hypothetical protein KPH14_010046 [Odynerus spinipes]